MFGVLGMTRVSPNEASPVLGRSIGVASEQLLELVDSGSLGRRKAIGDCKSTSDTGGIVAVEIAGGVGAMTGVTSSDLDVGGVVDLVDFGNMRT